MALDSIEMNTNFIRTDTEITTYGRWFSMIILYDHGDAIGIVK
jgi:hypothetical protein